MAAVEAIQEASAAESLLRCLRYLFSIVAGLCDQFIIEVSMLCLGCFLNFYQEYFLIGPQPYMIC